MTRNLQGRLFPATESYVTENPTLAHFDDVMTRANPYIRGANELMG